MDIKEYDIVQICTDGRWVDYATVKTFEDKTIAAVLIQKPNF